MNLNLMTIAELTDRLDNLIHALELDIPAQMHVEIMQTVLPEIRTKIRKALIEETGEDPWENSVKPIIAPDDDY